MGRQVVIADMEEDGSGGLDGKGRTLIVKQPGNNAAVWQVLTVILVGIVYLFATDSIELKLAGAQSNGGNNNNDNNGNNDGSTTSSTSSSNHTSKSSITFGDHVELKHPPLPKPAEKTTSAPVEAVAVPEPTDPPVAPPPVAAPTNPPVAAPVATPTDPPVPAEPAPTEPPVAAEPAPTDAPVAAEPAPTDAPVAAEPAPTDPPVAAEPAPTEPPVEAVAAAPVELPAADIPVAVDRSSSSSTNTNERPEQMGDIPGGRRTYTRRGQPLSDKDRQGMIKKWGSWTLVDDKERPQTDYYKEYPNRDIPRDKFPKDAWQIDKTYLSKFLPEGIALAQRAQDAILAEYGKDDPKKSWEENAKMYEIEKIPEDELEEAGGLSASGRRGSRTGRDSTYQGGWTTPNSWEGLKQRMLHAVMTEDSFVFAMGGHSAAAGHGNHFSQSYALQVQWILESVFARLGVRHEARNFGNGGLGTVHNGISAPSFYGPDIDVLMWDSGMTEGPEGADLAARQAMMGGTKVPALWTLAPSVAKSLHLQVDADVGYVGMSDYGIPIGETLEEINAMPWAMQYVRCTSELSSVCRENEYAGRCWIDRDDFTPETAQKQSPGGRAKWHPGNRKHQVTGRVLAFTFLQALKEALTEWNEADGYELPDSAWHLTERYEKVRNNFATATEPIEGACNSLEKGYQAGYLCNNVMKGRTEFTPRSYPTYSSLHTLLRPELLTHLNSPPDPVYWPPDAFNPDLHPPPGAIDVLNIVEAGVDFRSVLVPDYTGYYKKPTFAKPPHLPVGKGILADMQVGDSYCDGTMDSWCKKGPNTDCLLYGHNDGRNGLVFSSVSGWVVLNIPDLKNGIIVLKIESWHTGENWKTEGWTTENNERRLLSSKEGATMTEQPANKTIVLRPVSSSSSSSSWRDDDQASIYHNNNNNNNNNSTLLQETKSRRQNSRRNLKNKPEIICGGDNRIEYAIDGKITTIKAADFEETIKRVQRVVQLVEVLNDKDYTGGKEMEVEVAIRMLGCERQKAWKLTHVYWS